MALVANSWAASQRLKGSLSWLARKARAESSRGGVNGDRSGQAAGHGRRRRFRQVVEAKLLFALGKIQHPLPYAIVGFILQIEIHVPSGSIEQAEADRYVKRFLHRLTRCRGGNSGPGSG